MKKISFGPKPASSAQSPDQWVTNEIPQRPSSSEPNKRLTIDVPLSLHRRIKTQCVINELVMADVIRELLERRFPEAEPGSAVRAGSGGGSAS